MEELRKLWDTDQVSLKSIGYNDEAIQELRDLVTSLIEKLRVAGEVEKAFQEDVSQRFEGLATSIETAVIKATEGNISNLSTVDLKTLTGDITTLVTQNLSSSTLTAEQLNVLRNTITEVLTTSVLDATTATVGSETVGSLEADSIETTDLISDTATLRSIRADTVQANSATFTSLSTDSMTFDEVTSSSGNIGALTTDDLKALQGGIDNLKEGDIGYTKTFSVSDLNANGYAFIALEDFPDGIAQMDFRQGSDLLWQLQVFKSGKQCIVFGGRDTRNTSNSYISQIVINDITNYNKACNVYLKVTRTGKLTYTFWHSNNSVPLVQYYNELPFTPTSGTYVYNIKVGSWAWFPLGLEYGNDGGVLRVLTLQATSSYDDSNNEEAVEYNTQHNVLYKPYRPDQSLNTDDSVVHKDITVDRFVRNPSFYVGTKADLTSYEGEIDNEYDKLVIY